MITVQVPGPAQDRPSWKSVAIIAGVGFAVGIAWPRLAGVRLGPSLPEIASASSIASGPVASAVVPSAVPSPSALASAAPAPATGLAAPALLQSSAVLGVAPGMVVSCKTSDGDALRGADCGKLQGLDGVVQPRLRKLADCSDAIDASGKLQLLVHLDFARGSLSAELGHGQSVASPDALLACARTDLAGASFARVAHENPRYTVGYAVTFANVARASDGGSASAHPTGEAADATALVVWEVAIVRDVPKTGRVLARLQRGAQLRVGPVKDGWYPVQYGDGFSNEGWVYRGAIGR